MKYPNDMDKECIPLCDAINSVKGLMTVDSCCGHGKEVFRIFLHIDQENELEILLYYIHSCHNGFIGWQCIVRTDCLMQKPSYRIESKSKGKKVYHEANEIAKLINEFLDERDHSGDE